MRKPHVNIRGSTLLCFDCSLYLFYCSPRTMLANYWQTCTFVTPINYIWMIWWWHFLLLLARLRDIGAMDISQKLEDHRGFTSNTSFKLGESKAQNQWTPVAISIASFLAFLILLTSVGNAVVCRLVWGFRRMRIPSFCFVASMSISDLLMGVVVIPISLGYHITFQTTGKVSNLTWGNFSKPIESHSSQLSAAKKITIKI